MPVVELDMMIALVNSSDLLHEAADRLFRAVREGRLKSVRIAVSALLEYELLLRSRGVAEAEIRGDLRAFAMIRNLGEQPLTTEAVTLASELRERHGLTYFDSLHCASAILFDGKIISVDEAYDTVPSVSRIDPRSLR